MSSKKSGEYILNYLYQHRKSLNQIKQNDKNSENQTKIEDIKDEDLSIINLNHIMSEEEENQIRKSLRNHFVFKDITQDVLNLVINELIYCPFKKDTIMGMFWRIKFNHSK